MARFLCAHVRHNKGSTRSVRGLLSLLRVHCRRQGFPWLTEVDAYLLKQTVVSLEYEDRRPSLAKAPATLDVLIMVCQTLDPSVRTTPFSKYCFYSGTTAFFGRPSCTAVCSTATSGGTDSEKRLVFLFIAAGSAGTIYGIGRMPMCYPRWQCAEARLPCTSNGRCREVSGDTPSRPTFTMQATRRGATPVTPEGGATNLFTLGTSYPIIKEAGRWTSDAAL